MVHESSDAARAARGKSAAQRGSGYIPAPRRAQLRAAAAEAVPLAQRIKTKREGDRIVVTIQRKYERVFSLGLDECGYLAGLLAAHVGPVTVTRIEDRGAER